MTEIADGLLVIATLTLAIYCFVISRRLRALGRLDKGVGAAIASLAQSTQETRAALAGTQSNATELAEDLSRRTARAEQAAGRLELLLATLHDTETGTQQPVETSKKNTNRDSLRGIYKAMGG